MMQFVPGPHEVLLKYSVRVEVVAKNVKFTVVGVAELEGAAAERLDGGEMLFSTWPLVDLTETVKGSKKDATPEKSEAT